jgi:hypothetical protein
MCALCLLLLNYVLAGTFSQQPPSQQLPRARVITNGSTQQHQQVCCVFVDSLFRHLHIHLYIIQTTIGGHLPSVQGVEPLTTAKLASMNTKVCCCFV